MIVTQIILQQRDKNRVNIMIDGKFRFSLDVYQVADLGIKVGNEYTEQQLNELEHESQFGKLYSRALEYCLMRPHSAKEVRDYLYRKTLAKPYKTRTGEVVQRDGVNRETANRVFERLCDKGYVDDEKFARFWVENRNRRKGVSMRKLRSELMAKGVESTIIDAALKVTDRNDIEELKKLIEKKKAKYPDNVKFMRYLAGQGFSYDAITLALESEIDGR